MQVDNKEKKNLLNEWRNLMNADASTQVQYMVPAFYIPSCSVACIKILIMPS